MEDFAALKAGDDFDFVGNDMPVCPHCGEENEIDPFELRATQFEVEIECYNCEKFFTAELEYEIRYTTLVRGI